MGAYKVFPVEGGYQIFWCPSAPLHYDDRKAYNNKVYPQRAGAYRRVSKLNKDLGKLSQEEKEPEPVGIA